eukprot:gene53360-61998_t
MTVPPQVRPAWPETDPPTGGAGRAPAAAGAAAGAGRGLSKTHPQLNCCGPAPRDRPEALQATGLGKNITP